MVHCRRRAVGSPQALNNVRQLPANRTRSRTGGRVGRCLKLCMMSSVCGQFTAGIDLFDDDTLLHDMPVIFRDDA
jgi:hypothetical protein